MPDGDPPTAFIRFQRIPDPKEAPENPRRWMVIKFGLKTPVIRDKKMIITFCEELYKLLNEQNLKLDIRPSPFLPHAQDEATISEVLDRATKDVLENPPLRLPILLFIEDIDGSDLFSRLQARYHNHMFMFLVTGDEAGGMIRANDFSLAKSWCEEFGRIVTENDVQRAQDYPTILRRKEAEEMQRKSEADIQRRKIENESLITRPTRHDQDRLINMPIPSKTPPKRSDEKIPQLVDSDEECSRILADAQPYENYRIVETPELEGTTRAISPKLDAEDVNQALDALAKEPNLHISTLIDIINTDNLHDRLQNPFNDLCTNIKLLKTIALSCLTENTDMQDLVHDLLEATVASGFLVHILEKFLIPIVEERIQLDLEPHDLAYCVSTIFHVFKILSLKHIINPETIKLWNITFSIYKEMPVAVNRLMPADTEKTLRIIMEGPEVENQPRATSSKQNAIMDTPFVEHEDGSGDGWGEEIFPGDNFLKKEFTIPKCDEQPSRLNLNIPCLWTESERTAPPGDFRKLDAEIVRGDLFNPEKPYLRRMKTEGAFENAEEYLDTVYRLFREDMVSPFRDGLFIWKQHGYNTRRDPDGLAPDLFIMEGVRIRGVQVKSGTGETMRMIEIPRQYLARILEQRKLSFGQMIGLSCDGFKESIHLAYVIERDDDLLKTRNYIGVGFIDERDGLNNGGHAKLDTEYCLIESAGFLEMYTHVLSSLKKMNRFLPIPFERYIVHGCTNVLRPVYMRLETPESVIKERANLETYYIGRRLEAKAKIIAECERKRESQMALENNAIDTDYKSSRKKRNKEEKLAAIDLSETNLAPRIELTKMTSDDLEVEEIRQQIEEAENYVPRPYAPNQRMLQQMEIRGESYDISALNEQFDTTNSLMDRSQRAALFQALTQELVIIQGPPGTGKTFIGVEIIAALLANRLRWCVTEPILIVCYTNQALDQFLERIHQRIQEDMVRGHLDHEGPIMARLGTRSESAYIKDVHKLEKRDVIDAWREQLPPLQKRGLEPPRVLYGRRDETELELGSAATILRLAATRMIDGKNTLLGMSDLHRKQFLDHYLGMVDTKGHLLSPDEKLVSWLLERQFSRDAQNVPPSSRRKSESDSDDSEPVNRLKKKADSQGQTSVDNEEFLEDAFTKLAMKLEESRGESIVNEKEEVFEVLENWRFGRDHETETQRMEREVLLFGRNIKQGEIRFNNSKIVQDPTIIKAMKEHEHNVLKAEPLTESEAETIQNIFTLPRQRRWQLYAYWRHQLIKKTKSILPQIMANYKKSCDALKQYRLLDDVNILRKTLVIGATTTGAAKNRELLERLKCRNVVVEEAAEVLEAHVLSTFLPSVEHVVLIGDHEQLRPNPTVYALAREYGLDCSLFERLYKNKFPCAVLEVQHRMRMEMTEVIVRPHFYSRLLDHEDVTKYPAVKGMDKNLFFWTHQVEEFCLGPDSVSHRNDYEILQAVELTRYLLKQDAYKKTEITVLCTYAAQTNAMRDAIGSQFGTYPDGRTEVPVETVDGFQGKENRIIILSLVRSFSESNTVGFLGVKNRICVSWTRAQHGLYVLGNMEFLARKSKLWQDLANSLAQPAMVGYNLPIRCYTHGRLQKITDPGEFIIKSPEGGCTMECLASLPCSHKCPRKCHPIDDHATWRCEYLMQKTCVRKIHQAEKFCCEQYGPCHRMVDISLPCNHTAQIACFMNDSEATCTHRCERILPCGHQCAKRCGEQCEYKCNQLVEVLFHDCPYRHTKMIQCNLVDDFERKNVFCDHPCVEILGCDHKCSNKCGENCTFECPVKVRRLKECSHQVEMQCHEDPVNVKCQEPVMRKLGCGHECMVPCFAGKNRKFCDKACFTKLECGLDNAKHTCTRKCGECFESGHMCTSTCERPFLCGHICLARCGVECPPCEQKCYTQCEHLICGKSKDREDYRIGFDRTCPEICALCSKACSNSCAHRACSKKCYEECDVSPCNERCVKSLKCGHPCLGFCGNFCPDLCFRCNRQQYDYLIKNFLPEDFKKGTDLARFVKLSCSHIFPDLYLDDHVKSCCEKKTIITCPLKNCRLPIQLCQRYAGACKRAIISREKQKAIILGRLDQTRKQDATKSLLQSLANVVIQLKNSQPGKKNTTMTIHDRFKSLLHLAKKIELCLQNPSLIQDIDYRGAEHYIEWNNSLKLLEFLTQFHRHLLFNQQKKLKRFPQRLCFLNQMFNLLQNDVFAVEESLDFFGSENSNQICELANIIEDNIDSHLPGTFIPLVLFEIQKLAFSVSFLMLYRAISASMEQVVDITKDQCNQIEKLARKFLSTDNHSDRHLLFGELMKMIDREIVVCQRNALRGFILPDLSFPKF